MFIPLNLNDMLFIRPINYIIKQLLIHDFLENKIKENVLSLILIGFFLVSIFQMLVLLMG